MGLAAISYDRPEILAAFSRRFGITFPLLADAGSATISRFGLLNTIVEEALASTGDDPAVMADVKKYVAGRASADMIGIAFPGIFVLDRQGRVRSRFFEDYYRERSSVSSVLLRVGAAGGSVKGTQISTDHLEITTYPSDGVVAPGERFALVLEIEPRMGIHVYAPGASGYRVIGVSMTPPPFVRALPVQHPASEIYFFRPLNERVPVYQKPFTLVQEVVVESTPEALAWWNGKENLTLTGALNYQACDDKICFNPVALSLSWSVGLRPLITEAIGAPGR